MTVDEGQAAEGAVLVVEDDPGIAALECRRLERAGYRVIVATTATEALTVIERDNIALLVLDYGLPGDITGLEFYRQLKTVGRQLPVIMVTGQSNETTVVQALREGVRDFITKSVTYLDYLPEAVERVLAQVRIERQLEASEQRFRALVQNSSDGIIVVDTAGAVQYASPAVERILGYPHEELLASNYFDLVHPGDRAVARQHFEALLPVPGAAVAIEARVRRRDGAWRQIEATSTNLLHEPGIGAIVANFRDITERKALERQLAHQAFHDSLTGLPNRALFTDRLDHALARAARRGESIAVLFLDLDRFKVINDSLGHAAGDCLLVAVAQRLCLCVRAEDTVARLGGDEFTVLLEAISDSSEAVRVAGRIVEELSGAFSLAGDTGAHEVFTSASIGIVLNTSPADTSLTLLRDADVALYRAKQAGKARYAVFDPAMSASAVERLELETELRRAIGYGECAEFALHYQPIVDLATDRVVGLEALARWRHPRRGAVSPREFIPLAEETGLILPLGGWVLREACRQARAWQVAYPAAASLGVSVNLSARQFMQPTLVAEVAEILAESGLAPECLTLEITETVLMAEAALSGGTLRALQELGVRLAIDDFGTGYSSLAYLKHFPVAMLKIDRTFVAEVTRDEQDAAIVGAVVILARTLGLVVIAEGVETVAAAERLRDLGCDLGQGYHFAKPLTVEGVETLLREHSSAPEPATAESCAVALLVAR